MDKARTAAIHEAGHGVAAYLLCRPMALLIHDDGRGQAGAAVKPDDPPLKQTDAEREAAYMGKTVEALMDDAAIIVAGVMAEALATYDPAPNVKRSDRAAMDAVCRSLFHDADNAVLVAFGALAMARARSMLTEHWQRVEEVADALMERRYLSAEDVVKLM